jgi:flagellar biogenesis protein FliO
MVFLAMLVAGAGAVWWRRRAVAFGDGAMLRVRESLALSPRRALLLVQVGTRSVLVASTESGVTLITECPPETLISPSFGDALHSVQRGADDRTEPSLMSAPSPSSSSLAGLSSAMAGDAEATDIRRRLQGKSA